jgi:hypothetical protein
MSNDVRSRPWHLLLCCCVGCLLLFAAVVDKAAEPADGAHSPRAAVTRPPLGRIFFSPAERRAARSPPAAARSAASIAQSDSFSVDGAVSSSARGRAVWINGVPIENSVVKKTAWTDAKGNIWFKTEALGTHAMRPGQTIDQTGKIEDLLPAGAVTRR